MGVHVCGHWSFSPCLLPSPERRVDHIDIPGGGRSDSQYPHTPCSSLDPSALDQEEIRRIRQVQVATTLDPQQLADGLANISLTSTSEWCVCVCKPVTSVGTARSCVQGNPPIDYWQSP